MQQKWHSGISEPRQALRELAVSAFAVGTQLPWKKSPGYSAGTRLCGERGSGGWEDQVCACPSWAQSPDDPPADCGQTSEPERDQQNCPANPKNCNKKSGCFKPCSLVAAGSGECCYTTILKCNTLSMGRWTGIFQEDNGGKSSLLGRVNIMSKGA